MYLIDIDSTDELFYVLLNCTILLKKLTWSNSNI